MWGAKGRGRPASLAGPGAGVGVGAWRVWNKANFGIASLAGRGGKGQGRGVGGWRLRSEGFDPLEGQEGVVVGALGSVDAALETVEDLVNAFVDLGHFEACGRVV